MAIRRSSASASGSVSVIIPRISAIDVTATAHSTAANRPAGVDVIVFQSGGGAILVRTAPEVSRNPLQRASFRKAAPSLAMTTATRQGWQQLHDTPPEPRASRTSTVSPRLETTYELWQF